MIFATNNNNNSTNRKEKERTKVFLSLHYIRTHSFVASLPIPFLQKNHHPWPWRLQLSSACRFATSRSAFSLTFPPRLPHLCPRTAKPPAISAFSPLDSAVSVDLPFASGSWRWQRRRRIRGVMGPVRGFRKRKRADKRAAATADAPKGSGDWWVDFSCRITGSRLSRDALSRSRLPVLSDSSLNL